MNMVYIMSLKPHAQNITFMVSIILFYSMPIKNHILCKQNERTI